MQPPAATSSARRRAAASAGEFTRLAVSTSREPHNFAAPLSCYGIKWTRTSECMSLGKSSCSTRLRSCSERDNRVHSPGPAPTHVFARQQRTSRTTLSRPAFRAGRVRARTAASLDQPPTDLNQFRMHFCRLFVHIARLDVEIFVSGDSQNCSCNGANLLAVTPWMPSLRSASILN